MSTIEDVTIRIAGNRWRFWEQIEIRLALDNFSTIEFTAPFEPGEPLFRDTFRPFRFPDLGVEVGRLDGEPAPLFTGQLIGVDPRVTPENKSVSCSGYSLPAQLADVNAPASAFPLEFNGLTLRQIAERLAEPFGLVVDFDVSDGPAFRRVKIKPADKIQDFLIKLAKQRGFLISDTADGRLRFRGAIAKGEPVAKLKEGQQPLISVTATFSPQSYYSEITGLSKTKPSRRGSRYTVTNPKLPGVVRPLTYTAEDVRAPDLPTATQAKMGRMFGNMVAYVIELPSWRDPSGALFEPNTLISVEAPGAMIYNESTFLVRDVVLTSTANESTASLGLVLPGSFTGQIPEVLPWE